MLLFEPFLDPHESQTLIPTPLGTTTTVTEVKKQSEANFEIIIRLYYLRHGFATYSPVMLQFLSVLGFSFMKKIQTAPPSSTSVGEDSKSSLLLAALGLNHQGRSAYLSHSIFRLMYEGLPLDAMNLVNTYLDLEKADLSSQMFVEYVRAAYPVNMASIDDDAEERSVENLLQNLKVSDSETRL